MRRDLVVRERRVRAAGAAAGVAAALALFLGAALHAAPPAKKGPAQPAKVRSVTVAIRHRIFQNFRDTQSVALQKDFPVGDTEYSARIVRYVPDFAMDLDSGKVLSRSNEPKNPAFQIVVREKGVPQDTSWAFLNMPPHFGRKSLLAFKIVRIDFVDRPSVVADTTTAAAKGKDSTHPRIKP